MKLEFPLGDHSKPVSISNKTQTIRFSLQTNQPDEVKSRQARAAAYLEDVFKALRRTSPVSLTHPQTVALSKDIYLAWAKDAENYTSLTLEKGGDGEWFKPEPLSTEEIAGAYRKAHQKLERIWRGDEPEELEKEIGPLVKRVLLEKGIAEVTGPSRTLLLFGINARWTD